jgi:hypothetical protein
MNGSNRAAWVTEDNVYPNTSYLRMYVENSRFYVTGKQAGWSTWYFSWPELKDFYLETTFTTGACSGKDAYGQILRGPVHKSGKSYGYVVSLSCDGAYRIYRVDSTDPSFTTVTLVDWTASTTINAGSNQTNVLGVKAEGKTIVVYVNGTRLAEVTDDTYTQGRYGLYVSGSDTTNFTYQVVKMAYWELGKK